MNARAAVLVAIAAAVLAPTASAAPVQVTTSVSPHPMLFGDVIHATLTVRADGPARLGEGFAPFEVLDARSTQRRSGGRTVTTWRLDLQCLQAVCAPGAKPRSVPLAPSRVQVGSRFVDARFPPVLVIPRVHKGQVARPLGSFMHPIAPQPPSYRFSPARVRLVLAGAAAVLVLIALVLVLPLLRSRRATEDEQDADALARALALVRASRTRPPPDRRRALGLLSRTLRTRAAPATGQDAADLAWSEPEPDPVQMTRLADRVEGAP